MTVNSDGIINRLLNAGVIIRGDRRGYYRMYQSDGSTGYLVSRERVLSEFAREVEYGRYQMREERFNEGVRFSRIARNTTLGAFIAAQNAAEAARPVLRTIRRNGYHINGGGINRDGLDLALEAIPYDADGYRRSYGLEWEVYSLTPTQEDKLANLLDTLPPHVVERDASLGATGLEIVFMPMSAAEYIDTFTKLKRFTLDNNVAMNMGDSMAGAHTTFGMQKEGGMAYPAQVDLQIRLNRLALAVKSVGTQRAIASLFGRDFMSYATLPQSRLARVDRYQAFNTQGRGNKCWELRLMTWKADPQKIVDFFAATEFVFNRPVEASDFMKVFELLGADTDGE